MRCANEGLSRRSVPEGSGVCYNPAALQPHRVAYWLNAQPDEPAVFVDQVTAGWQVDQQARSCTQQGGHVRSTDEQPGLQALERAAPTWPLQPGVVERPAYAYSRHGTPCLSANVNVAPGESIAPSRGATRTAEDLAAPMAQTIATAPEAPWICIVDQLNSHQLETLGRLVARACRIEEDVGEKEKRGVLKSRQTRAAFLSDVSHRIRLLSTPKHTSGLNQIERWFSLLVRRLLKRGNVTSVEDLRERILAFINYFNRTMATPFKWTYTGRPLTA
jgi:DDE superfamily endonuclease